MERIERELFPLGCPCFADGFVGCEAFEGFEAAAEIVGVDEVGQVASELLVCFVVEAFDGGFLECPVHAFDLSVGPRVAWFGQPVIDATLGTCVFESMREEWLAQIHGAADFCGC